MLSHFVKLKERSKDTQYTWTSLTLLRKTLVVMASTVENCRKKTHVIQEAQLKVTSPTLKQFQE